MPENILLIDDEKDFLDVMTERMEARGFEVSTSMSAKEALGMIKKGAYDAIILDLQMPGMDGIEALKAIKDIQPEAQIILLTGHATVEKGVEAIKLGATDFIEKPADLETLSRKIKNAHAEKIMIVEKKEKEAVIDALKRFGM
ncbi:response regulator [Desulfococcus sp.]|uniref:response regulator n=1 Tax=Desulfococcus sp. TaxID=2025834 RepID=UPI003D0BC2DF